MSLGRLLTSGKSLVGLKTREGHYRMHPRNLLPKFGSSKNPFVGRADAEASGSVASIPEPPRSPACELTPREVAAASLKETRRLPAVSSPGKTGVGTAGSMQRARARLGVLASRLNPLSWWSKSKDKRTSRSAAFQSARTEVQGELCLDNVKVVRNDLTDADVEVVPTRPGVPSQEASEARRRESPALLDQSAG